MRNYFLGSVGKAELFKKVNGELVHFASAKTLTDSSINLSVSAEEVRGGEGAQLLGQFFHTSNFGLQLTDSMFHLEYIEAQVGGHIEDGGYGMVDYQVTTDSAGRLKLDSAKGYPVELMAGTKPLVWYNRPNESEYATHGWADTDETDGFIVPGAPAAQTFCVHYLADKAAARKLIVNANFVPSELIVFLTTRLFAGDASAPETGKPVGSVTVKIPRFQLNGTMDIALAMASAATIQMQGTALAYEDDCNGAKYAEIVEFVEGSIYDGYESGSLVFENGTNEKDSSSPRCYLIADKKTPLLVENESLTGIQPASDVGTDNKLKTPLAAPITYAEFTWTDGVGVAHTVSYGTKSEGGSSDPTPETPEEGA